MFVAGPVCFGGQLSQHHHLPAVCRRVQHEEPLLSIFIKEQMIMSVFSEAALDPDISLVGKRNSTD